jgi:hypothetical protein
VNDEVDEHGRRAATLFGVAAALHVGLLAYFTPRGLLFSGKPIHEYDYALHAYQVDRAAAAWKMTGHFWSYDPFMLAGQPANVFEDVTNKALELFVIVATRIGSNPWIAFNVYVFLIHASVPIVGWVSARLFGLSRTSASLTALGWVTLWHFDSFLHWCWYVGMIAWGAASALIVLAVALMYRALRERRLVHFAGFALTLAGVALIHPFSAVTLALPLGALYARAFKTLSAREHALLAAAVGGACATTIIWLVPAIQFRRHSGDVDAFLWPTLRYVVFDWFDLLKDVLMTGQPVRTAFRVLALAVAVVGLGRLRRVRDDRFLPLATLVVGSFALAYLSGYSTLLRQTQPYRNVGPGALAAAMVAAMEVPLLLRTEPVARWSRDARTVFAIGAVALVPGLVKTCLGYMPTLVPDRFIARSTLRPGPLPGVSNDEYAPAVLGHMGAPAEYAEMGRYLDGTLGQRGRAVVLDWVLGEYLATFSHVPIVGGIPQRNVPHVAAHPLRHDFTPNAPSDDTFSRYLESYAVGVVVVTGEHNPIEDRIDLLAADRAIGDHRVYRTRAEPSYFERGSGRVAAQSLNRIRIEDAAGPEVILRFHHWETLTCKPNCRVERADVDRDPAGFIRIANPPAIFEIESR